MSGILEMRDGYGWTVSGSSIEVDGDGYYYLADSGAGSDTIIKTIAIDNYKISPVYIFEQCRVYSMAANTAIDVAITGLTIGAESTTTALAIADSSSILVTIEGYATSADVVVTFSQDAVGDDFKIYPMSEAGT